MAELQIPITKGKGIITINTDDVEAGGDLTPAVYREALLQGLKVILNRGQGKITKENYTGKDGVVDEALMKAEAMKKAEQTLKDMREDKIRFMGEKVKTKVAGEVVTEARKIARGYVKEALKADGKKIAHYSNREITAAANEMIAENPEIVAEAQSIVDARKAAAAGGGKIDLKKFAGKLKADAKLVAKDEKEKAERKAAGSATKAGKVAVRARAKPGAQAGAVH